ncbi:MAG: hypothetical protein ACOZNI_08860 [Myxococcota bacterium]
MWWLFGCSTPAPPLVLPVSSPATAGATALPATRFVGPLDVSGAPRLCDADRGELLADGTFGWRVIAVSGGRVVFPPDLEALARRWRDEDRMAAIRCPAPLVTDVLVAGEGDVPAEVLALLPGKVWRLAEARVEIRATDTLAVRELSPRSPAR